MNQRHARFRMAIFAAAILIQAVAIANVPPAISLAADPYTQDFNSLISSGTSSVTPAGWAFAESGTSGNNNGLLTAGTGSSTAGDVYSFGASGNSDRAFGGLFSGTLTPTIGASFTNDTGETLTALTISYTGEQWRLGQNTAGRLPDRLDFQLSTDASSLTTGTWTNYNVLDFNSPVTTGTNGALDGNVAPNRTVISATITVNIPIGQSFWIRWAEFDLAPGSDDGLAVDDFSLIPGADGPPAVANVVPPNNATEVARNANVIVTFNEPVDAAGSSFSIGCAQSGEHTFALSHSADFKTYTLDPDEDFDNFEQCTITVLSSGVSDQDTDDPPDTMAANFTTGFTSTNAEKCGDPATFIHDIQGSGSASTYDGVIAAIEGIVVADFQGAGQFGGYYVQEEDADSDGNPATSEGIFVFSTNTAVNAGDKVRVTGTVDEFFNLTELTNVSKVLVCGSGQSVTPTPVFMPVATLSDWERYEGMLISIAQELTVTDNFTLGRFGEVVLSSGGRLYNPTAIAAPGAPALAQQDLNNLRRIVLDDGNNQQNIDPTNFPSGGLSASNTLRSGDTVAGITGILEERFNAYRIQRIGNVNFVASNPRQAAPDPVDGEIKAASMNVLNFFNGNGTGGGFPTERGANSLFEYNRQREKMLAAILALDADAIGLLEVENDVTDGHSAIEDIVSGLNDATGPGTWTFINTGPMGNDLIRNAIIYRQDVLTPVGGWAFLDGSIDPRFIDRGNRPALAQTFESLADGARFTLVVNHLRSKGSSCDSATSPFNDPDTGDGQGNCNLVRKAAAEAIGDWLATDPTGSGDADFLVVGDMNAYAKEDPITAFVTNEHLPLTDLVALGIGPEAYSFVFGGQSGYIDHALGSSHLVGQVSGVTEYHNNADEPLVLDYNVEFKQPSQIDSFFAPDQFRASDHDPLIVGLNLNAAPRLGPISAPAAPVAVNTPAAVSADFTDGDVDDAHTAVINWGDGTASAGTVSGGNGFGTVTGSHAYTAPGTYSIVVVVTDSYGDSDEQTYQYVVVFDPNGGFVTGGGWIDSPAGAFLPDPSLEGRANFGFVAKYLPSAGNAASPSGNLQFHVGKLKFRSTAYEWLLVSGGTAQFKGVGELDGAGPYGFLLTATDGAPDTFRIKIWYTDASGDRVVYDNGAQAIAGSIVVKR